MLAQKAETLPAQTNSARSKKAKATMPAQKISVSATSKNKVSATSKK